MVKKECKENEHARIEIVLGTRIYMLISVVSPGAICFAKVNN